jgi:hypothetical protein
MGRLRRNNAKKSRLLRRRVIRGGSSKYLLGEIREVILRHVLRARVGSLSNSFNASKPMFAVYQEALSGGMKIDLGGFKK